MTACGGGPDGGPETSSGTVPSNDTFKPSSAVTDSRSGAFSSQIDGRFLLPGNAALEISLEQKSDTTRQISLPASYRLCSTVRKLSSTAV